MLVDLFLYFTGDIPYGWTDIIFPWKSSSVELLFTYTILNE